MGNLIHISSINPVHSSIVEKTTSNVRDNKTWDAFVDCSDPNKTRSAKTFVSRPETLDTSKYDYVAIRIKGDCLASRPEPINHGDTVAVRNLSGWFDFSSEDFLPNYAGRVVGLVIQGQIMVKELVFVDFANEVITVKMFNPQRNLQVSFRNISKVFLIDAIMSNPLVIQP